MLHGVLVISVHASDARTGSMFTRLRSARGKAFVRALAELAEKAELELERVVTPHGGRPVDELPES